MTTVKKAGLRPRCTIADSKYPQAVSTYKILLSVLAATIALSGAVGQAHASLRPYVIGSDRGGFIRDRQLEIHSLRASGQPVEIRGAVCYSTCTMLLGLPQTCISAATVFGFHGPSRNGTRLAADEFEHYSQLIAQYYPKPLRDWFMKKGRNRIDGVHRIKGSEIIRMGVKECSP